MKAILVNELGGPEVLSYEEIPEPIPKPSDVLVQIEAAGVNFLDIYYRSGFHWGGHHGVDLPYIPGAEGAGIVVALGDDVKNFDLGDRVSFGISNGKGAYAQFMAVPAWSLFKIPEAIDFEISGAVMQQGMTAHYLCNSVFPLTSNHTVLVHAAAGGTGLLLVQMAKLRNATVFGTVSSKNKIKVVEKAGADYVIVTSEQDFTLEIQKLTNQTGANVVFDSVGKDTYQGSLNSLAPRGAMVLYGQSSGKVPPLDTAILNARGSLSLWRPSLTDYVSSKNDVNYRAGDIFRWIEEKKLSVTIGDTFPLSEAWIAHQQLASRESIG